MKLLPFTVGQFQFKYGSHIIRFQGFLFIPNTTSVHYYLKVKQALLAKCNCKSIDSELNQNFYSSFFLKWIDDNSDFRL